VQLHHSRPRLALRLRALVGRSEPDATAGHVGQRQGRAELDVGRDAPPALPLAAAMLLIVGHGDRWNGGGWVPVDYGGGGVASELSRIYPAARGVWPVAARHVSAPQDVTGAGTRGRRGHVGWLPVCACRPEKDGSSRGGPAVSGRGGPPSGGGARGRSDASASQVDRSVPELDRRPNRSGSVLVLDLYLARLHRADPES
jgi:hypothetical protein